MTWKQLFKEEFTRFTFTELLRAILAILATVTAAFITSSFSLDRLTAQFAVMKPYEKSLVFVLTCLLLWVALLVWDRVRADRPAFPKIGFDFRVLERTITYTYTDRYTMRYRRHLKLKTLKNGLDRYVDKYHWTGSGDVQIVCRMDDQTLRQTEKKNVWQFFEVLFNRTLKKGEEIEVDVEWVLKDTQAVAVPFFSATVEEPTEKLLLNLELAPSLGVKQVTKERSYGIGAKKPFGSEAEKLDSDGKMSWVIHSPYLLHHYEVRWTFPRTRASA